MILKQVRYLTLPMNSARTSGSQSKHWATAACRRRFWADFVHIVDIFGRRASRLGNLGAGVTNGQTSRQSDGSETSGGKGTTQPPQQILIVNKSRWQSTNTGSLTIHKYRIHPDKIRSTKYSDKYYHYTMYVVWRLRCIKYSLYPPGQMMSILLLGGLTRKVKIAKHWRHLGSVVESYS